MGDRWPRSKTGVLVISWNFPPKLGGMEDLISSLCKHLRRSRPLLAIAPRANSLESQQSWVFRASRRGLLPFAIYALYQGYRLLRKSRELRIVLAGSAVVAPLALILARLFRRKAVVLVHGLDLIHPGIIYRLLCARWVRHFDRVIANSNHTARLARDQQIAESSVRVIAPGVDVGCFDTSTPSQQAREELGLKGRKVVLFVGRLARRKGVKEFVQACLPRVVAEVRETIFVIVGGNPTEALAHRDDMMGEIEAAVRQQNLAAHVRLFGWLSDANLAKIYRAADLLVMPVLPLTDDVEGFGIVILEAAAAGVPAVATRVGGMPDAIEDGKSGILVEPGDYGGMSRAIIGLLRDDQSRLALGEYAQRRARERFAWPVIAASYEQMLSSLTSDRRQCDV